MSQNVLLFGKHLPSNRSSNVNHCTEHLAGNDAELKAQAVEYGEIQGFLYDYYFLCFI